MDGRTDRHTKRDGWKNGWKDDGWTDIRRDGWKNGWIDGQTDRHTDGRTYEGMNGSFNSYLELTNT